MSSKGRGRPKGSTNEKSSTKELLVNKELQPLREEVSSMRRELDDYKENKKKGEIVIHEAPISRVAFVLRCAICKSHMYELESLDAVNMSAPRIMQHNFKPLNKDTIIPNTGMRPHCNACNNTTDLELIIDNIILS